MRRLPSFYDAVLHERLFERATHAAKNALVTCALAFGRDGRGEREVLFAEAQSYTACTRVLRGEERPGSRLIDGDHLQALRTQLATAEEELCAAAKALSGFGRRTVHRLIRAASTYARAWELERCCVANGVADGRARYH